jgi:hypothetical protein
VGAAAFASALLAAGQASAQQSCNSGLPGTPGGPAGTVIYGAGGSAQLPLITQIGIQLARLSPPVTLVYSSAGSACAGYADLVTPTPVNGSANYFTAAGASPMCTFDPGGTTTTFAVMGNAPNLCPSTTGLAAGFGQFLGPAQPIDFVVPVMSSQQSISTAAAFDIWGFAASDQAHTVSPWNVPANILTRSATSFVNVFTALDTGVPAAVIATKGTLESTNSATAAALAALNSNNPESGIGFVSGEVADGDRKDIRVLAYQHTGQSCGYWPDSTVDAFDKANVRDGQYWLWSPVHFFAATDANGAITDANTANLIGYFTGAVAPPAGVDVFAADNGAFTVPQCAMHAWRDGDLAPLYSFAPPNPCSCKFDIATRNANKPASCFTCTQDSDCGTQHCRNIGPPLTGTGANVGYCEAY